MFIFRKRSQTVFQKISLNYKTHGIQRKITHSVLCKSHTFAKRSKFAREGTKNWSLKTF